MYNGNIPGALGFKRMPFAATGIMTTPISATDVKRLQDLGANFKSIFLSGQDLQNSLLCIGLLV